MESACGGGSCGSDPFDRDDFEPIAPLLECATCRGEGAGLPGIEAIYCISLKEQPNRAKAAAELFHALGLCRHVTMYRPHRGRHMPRAIWTSHRAVACHAQQQGFRRVAIFEDDVMIKIGGERLRRRVADALRCLPSQAWGLYLGHTPMQAYPVSAHLMRTRSGSAHAYIANAALLGWIARTMPMDVSVPVAPWGTSIDAAMANLPHMFAMFPMVATQRFLGDHRVDPKFAAPGQRRKLTDPLRYRQWFTFHGMPLAEAKAVLLSPLHRLTLEHFRSRSGAALSRDATLIRASRLFDGAWYLDCYPDVAAAGREPLEHFLRDGAPEGRIPHPLFETIYYCRMYPQVARTRENPLAHFLRHGAGEGLNPNPLFDTAWYLDHNGDVASSGLHPLVHYVEIGAHERRPPHPGFDPRKYLARYPDVEAAGREALSHYLRHGAAEGRMIDPVG